MSKASTSALQDGVILNNRYRIVRQIGRGGFGRAYLAEDTQRYRELCVLKEFAPQVESERELHQAEDLFEREAGILYKLNHPQIPKFEALLKTRIEGRRSLFLVQEYIEGTSYWELLKRKGKLNETNVIDLIKQILPVLDYIHDAGLVHRDISPDNLILRTHDRQPVLIDFGCVKLAANAVSRSRGNSITLIGKKGYSPNEQLSCGQASRCSDLYSLAATVMVLLTGKHPDELYNSLERRWDFYHVKISFRLRTILAKMLAERPSDRYQSAEQVSQALLHNRDNLVLQSFVSRLQTLILAPGDYSKLTNLSKASFFSGGSFCPISFLTKLRKLPKAISHKDLKPWHWGMVAAGVIVVPGLVSFVLIHHRIATTAVNFEQKFSDRSIEKEVNLQRKIHQRVESLSIDASTFYSQVDRIFHDKYPELVGIKLTRKKEHWEYRKTWYQIAHSLLSQQERQR